MLSDDLLEIITEELRRGYLENQGMFRDAVEETRALQEQMETLTEEFIMVANVSLKIVKSAVTLLHEFD